MPQMEIQGQVGRQSIASGTVRTLRQLVDGAQGVADTMPSYSQLVRDGLVYIAQTAATGVAPGTAVGTTAAAALYNPLSSGVDAILFMVSMGYVSGTLGAGFISYCGNVNPAAAATTGTAMAVVNAALGSTAANKVSPLTTATLPVAPTIMRPFASLGASLASTAVQPWQIWEDLKGAIVLKPGSTISLQATAAAGSTPLVVYGFVWAEVPTSLFA